MVKGFESMLAGSLDLEEPWYITGAEFDPVMNEIDVYVGIREDAVIACPHCGGPTKRYGYEPTERSWRHADCLFYPCYVHCKRPRVKALPHNSSAALAMPFLPSASCRNLDLPPVNLRFLQSHLTKNAFAIAPTHLCGIALNVITVASSKSQHLLNGRTAATPCYSKDMP